MRDQVVIATKFGFDYRWHGQQRARQPPRHIKRASPRLAEAAEDRPDRPALPASHRPGRPHRGRRRHRQGADRGRARSGTSASPRQAYRPSAGPTPSSRSTALQSEYSLWRREPEEAMLPTSRARHRLRPVEPARPGLPDGKDRRKDAVRRAPTSAHVPALHAGGPPANRPSSTCSADRRARRDPGPDRPRLAPRAEALDRPDPRHHEAAPPRREHRRRRGRLTADDLREIEETKRYDAHGARFSQSATRRNKSTRSARPDRSVVSPDEPIFFRPTCCWSAACRRRRSASRINPRGLRG